MSINEAFLRGLCQNNIMKNSKYFFLIFIFFLYGCQSPEEKFEKKISSILKLEQDLNQSSADWSALIEGYSTDPTIANKKLSKILDVNGEEYKSNFIRKTRNEFYINMITQVLDKNTDPELKKRIFELLIILSESNTVDTIPLLLPGKYSYLPLRNENYLHVLWVEGTSIDKYVSDSIFFDDIETRMLVYTEYANINNLYYNLSSSQFLADELCRAVDDNKLNYASALVDYSKDILNIGKIRCIEYEVEDPNPRYSWNISSMVEFKGNTIGMMDDSDVERELGVCPMSLRRVSGRNYGRAVAGRVHAFKSNLKQIDSSRIKSYSDAVTKIKQSISEGIRKTPKLSAVPESMNALLDKYDTTWMRGGDCSLESNSRFH